MSVDILFVAHGRGEFTRDSWRSVLLSGALEYSKAKPGEPESWLGIYTDGAQPLPHFEKFATTTKFGGPVACLNAFLKSSGEDSEGRPLPPEATSEFVCKIDNDVILPAGWLPACLDLMRRYPNVDLLGIEPWTPDQKLFPVWREPMLYRVADTRGYEMLHSVVRPVSHIGGIGVFRRSAFERFGRPVPNTQDGRYGFTEWQWQNPGMVKAFIDPPLPVFLLDHLPFEPWRSLSRRYEAEGIQRNVGWEYDVVRHRTLWGWAFASGGVLASAGRGVGGTER